MGFDMSYSLVVSPDAPTADRYLFIQPNTFVMCTSELYTDTSMLSAMHSVFFYCKPQYSSIKFTGGQVIIGTFPAHMWAHIQKVTGEGQDQHWVFLVL